MKNNKAALDLSIGTIVIVVIGVTMLILGMVLVRSIMCQAIGLTSDVNGKVKGELDRYFGNSGGEVVCIGSGGEPIKISTGTNNIYCAIKAPQQAGYEIKMVSSQSFIDTLTDDKLKAWVRSSVWSGNVAPGDQSVKKAITLNVPDTAPEGQIRVSVEIRKNGELISSQDLDLEVSRAGLVQNVVC